MAAIDVLRAVLAAGACVRLEPEMKARLIMQGTTALRTKRFGQGSISVLFICLCVLLFAAGCSKSDKSDGTLDTSRLPRVAGAKEVFASAASTIFTTTNSVAQTADTVDKALATEGWQKYVAPHTSLVSSDNQRTLSL